MTLGKKQAEAAANLASGMSRLTTGICVGINWTSYSAKVNVGGGVVDMPMAGDPPVTGDKVLVGFLGNQPVCIGPVPKPATGTVAGSPSGGRVTVNADDGVTYTVSYLSGYTPVSGNRVALEWSVPGGLILGAVSAESVPTGPTAPSVPDDTADAPTKPKTYSRTFNPTNSGSYRSDSGWWIDEVWSADNNVGAYFYGGQIDSSIPDSAEVLEIRLYLHSIYEFGDKPTIGVHTLSSKSGAPTVTSEVEVSGGSGWKKLPTGFGLALKNGTKKGVGTNHGGYHKFSPARSHNSGALYIKWRK